MRRLRPVGPGRAPKHPVYKWAVGHLGLPSIWKKKSRQSAFYPLRADQVVYITRLPTGCGRSSGVERYLAKVNVVSSNLIARSNLL